MTEWRRKQLDTAAGGLDGTACVGGHGVHLHPHGPVQLAPAEHFDQGTLADEAEAADQRERSALARRARRASEGLAPVETSAPPAKKARRANKETA